METVFVGDKNTEWYKKCREYLDNDRLQFEKAGEICSKYGIDIHNIALAHDILYLQYGIEYSQEVVKMCKTTPLYTGSETFYVVKKNSKLGKEITNAGIDKEHSPMAVFGLFGGIMGIRYSQFIHREHVYIRVISDCDIDCPKGFTVMSMSDFWGLVEKVKDKTSDYTVENI